MTRLDDGQKYNKSERERWDFFGLLGTKVIIMTILNNKWNTREIKFNKSKCWIIRVKMRPLGSWNLGCLLLLLVLFLLGPMWWLLLLQWGCRSWCFCCWCCQLLLLWFGYPRGFQGWDGQFYGLFGPVVCGIYGWCCRLFYGLFGWHRCFYGDCVVVGSFDC